MAEAVRIFTEIVGLLVAVFRFIKHFVEDDMIERKEGQVWTSC